MLGLMAKKVGMTQVFDDDGNLIPVTVMRIDPNIVIAQKTPDKDGYSAVVLGVDDMKQNRASKPYAGQFPENIAPKKRIREFRDFEKECAVGDSLGVELFEDCRYVDVTGVSKGKGFQGVVKRWGFGGGRNTHGSKFHREPGSTGQATSPSRTFKNVKMPGRMGRERVTVLSLRVVKVDVDNQLIMVHGAVPGINKGTVVVRPAVKK
ncbi:50S ribosomal protein L3 [Breznakiella homolactica]|uniref:Large ribosomal subunit protein uL3 n=1 Tax=Breznakiella homolactica TaxID=2798577 RepID=A0A7T7XQI3_9SPIR|nr:50S ribosomal protein L3 [Breznakiella homolactica]QQO10634.1 50S ribosomal protein L3 [Breznakiella homolactica]